MQSLTSNVSSSTQGYHNLGSQRKVDYLSTSSRKLSFGSKIDQHRAFQKTRHQVFSDNNNIYK